MTDSNCITQLAFSADQQGADQGQGLLPHFHETYSLERGQRRNNDGANKYMCDQLMESKEKWEADKARARAAQRISRAKQKQYVLDLEKKLEQVTEDNARLRALLLLEQSRSKDEEVQDEEAQVQEIRRSVVNGTLIWNHPTVPFAALSDKQLLEEWDKDVKEEGNLFSPVNDQDF